MAQQSIVAIAVEVSIAINLEVTELLVRLQRKGIALVVFGRDLNGETKKLEQRGLIIQRVYTSPKASGAFAQECLRAASHGARQDLVATQVLFVDHEEVRVSTYGSVACAPALLFDPDQETAQTLLGRLADYGLAQLVSEDRRITTKRPGKR